MNTRWSAARAWEWYDARPWIVGCNFLPSSAVNSTAMWQEATFAVATIDRELGWAAQIGLNAIRVFLPFLVYENDPAGFLARLDTLLGLADGHGIATVPILFDDCAFAGREPYPGPQDDPAPGVHNSQWTPSPGFLVADDPAATERLVHYVRQTIGRFADDGRVLFWDLYNEPGNSERGERSLPLLELAFAAARAARPSQPLTVGLWHEGLTALNERQLALSDIVTFHQYASLDDTRATIQRLRAEGRPIVCTEWMARTLGSRFETHLPLFRAERVGAIHWGLVRGRTQTHLPWGWSAQNGEPPLWFHDILHPDGALYDPEGEGARLRAALHRKSYP